MPKNPHPHVAWRAGRPRFAPGRDLRAAGFKGTDLRWPLDAPPGWSLRALKPGDVNAGRWFSRGEAVDWSDGFVRQLAALRAEREQRRARRPKPRRAEAYTVASMVLDWYASPRFVLPHPEGMKPSSIYSFKHFLRVLEDDHPLVWNAPAVWLEQADLRAAYEETWMKRGLATARQMILAISACYTWARLIGKVKRADNPAHKLMMRKPEPRIRFGTRKEIEALVAGADLLGHPDWGDMVLLAVWTGQRQADRIALCHKGMLNNRRYFRQSKTGAVVGVLQTPQLEARLKASIERRRAAKAEAVLAFPAHLRGKVEERFSHVVLDESRWLPFSGDHWSRCLAQLRAAVAAGIVDVEATAEARRQHAAEGRNTEPPTVWKLAPVPSVASLWDLDFRDTAVTWMALAGATIPEICAVTGHELETATQVLKHYLARHPEMADSAIGKMVAWYEAGGETEFGL